MIPLQGQHRGSNCHYSLKGPNKHDTILNTYNPHFDPKELRSEFSHVAVFESYRGLPKNSYYRARVSEAFIPSPPPELGPETVTPYLNNLAPKDIAFVDPAYVITQFLYGRQRFRSL